MLFYLYLIVIVLILLTTLGSEYEAKTALILWLERCSLSLGFTALFYSFGLPHSLVRIQEERLQEEIDRRQNATTNDLDSPS